MNTNQVKGKKGEELAAEWLLKQGFVMLHKNWRRARYEIDIIATKDQVLHFIEVKTRTSARFGNPEDQVNKKKLRHMIDAGVDFIYLNKGWKKIRFDILAIKLFDNLDPEFFFIEDVYS
ncbi:MAG: YraN family protein [Chitinophagaceae bacterium]